MGTGINDLTTHEAFEQLRKTDRQLYAQLDKRIALCQAGTVHNSRLGDWSRTVLGVNTLWNDIATRANITNLKAYMRDQIGDQTRDPVAEYKDWKDACFEVWKWIRDHGRVGDDPNGDGSGVEVDCTGLVPLLQALKATSE